MKKKVLLVDDVKLFLKLEETFFKRTGCQILTAGSGQEALERAQGEQPDLILLDYIMPDIMGDEVCARLKADPQTREIPVMIVSTSSDEKDMEKCFQAGADEYITKPINAQELLAKAAALLNIPHRVHCRTPVRFRVEGEAEGRTFTGYSKNISVGGLLLECSEFIAPGTDISVDLPVLPDKGIITVKARVVRADKDEERKMNYLGIQFRELEESHKQALEDFIEKVSP